MKDIFLSGCFDKIIRIWNVNKEKSVLTFLEIGDIITAI